VFDKKKRNTGGGLFEQEGAFSTTSNYYEKIKWIELSKKLGKGQGGSFLAATQKEEKAVERASKESGHNSVLRIRQPR